MIMAGSARPISQRGSTRSGGWIGRRPEQGDGGVISKGESLSLSALRILDAKLSSRTFLAGDVFSMGDIPAAATVHRWYALDIHHPDLRNVLRWYDLMRARPPFQRIVMTPLS